MPVEVACETCGETFNVSAYREKTARWCSTDCRYSPGRVAVECAGCGVEVERTERYMTLVENTYCSRECEYQNHRVERDCSNCAETVVRTKYEAEKNEKSFCDKECYDTWQRGVIGGVDHPRSTTEKVPCENCDSPLERDGWSRRRSEKFFCNHDCFGEWKARNWTGEDAPGWEGGYDGYYGWEWPKQRQKALNRDGHVCQGCGSGGENLEVHHIVPFREFDNRGGANELSNLVTLCKKCHVEWEGVTARPVLL